MPPTVTELFWQTEVKIRLLTEFHDSLYEEENLPTCSLLWVCVIMVNSHAQWPFCFRRYDNHTRTHIHIFFHRFSFFLCFKRVDEDMPFHSHMSQWPYKKPMHTHPHILPHKCTHYDALIILAVFFRVLMRIC